MSHLSSHPYASRCINLDDTHANRLVHDLLHGYLYAYAHAQDDRCRAAVVYWEELLERVVTQLQYHFTFPRHDHLPKSELHVTLRLAARCWFSKRLPPRPATSNCVGRAAGVLWRPELTAAEHYPQDAIRARELHGKISIYDVVGPSRAHRCRSPVDTRHHVAASSYPGTSTRRSLGASVDATTTSVSGHSRPRSSVSLSPPVSQSTALDRDHVASIYIQELLALGRGEYRPLTHVETSLSRQHPITNISASSSDTTGSCERSSTKSFCSSTTIDPRLAKPAPTQVHEGVPSTQSVVSFTPPSTSQTHATLISPDVPVPARLEISYSATDMYPKAHKGQAPQRTSTCVSTVASQKSASLKRWKGWALVKESEAVPLKLVSRITIVPTKSTRSGRIFGS